MTAPDNKALLSMLRDSDWHWFDATTGHYWRSVTPTLAADALEVATARAEAAEKALAEMTAQRNAAAALYLRTGSNS